MTNAKNTAATPIGGVHGPGTGSLSSPPVRIDTIYVGHINGVPIFDEIIRIPARSFMLTFEEMQAIIDERAKTHIKPAAQFQAATQAIAEERGENFSRAQDQARYESLGELFAADAAKIKASCVPYTPAPLTDKERAERIRAATHACAFMDYKQ